MSTPAQLRQGIARARADLLAALSVEGATVGADAAALIEDRIVTKGEKADGSRFSPYSTKGVPAYLYFGRSRNAAGEAAVRRKATARQPVSYKEFRQLNGLNTGVKNFQFTGEMWQGFGVKSVRPVRPGVVVVTLGGKNARTAELLGYHSAREGAELTALSKQELQMIETAINQRLINLVNRALNV